MPQATEGVAVAAVPSVLTNGWRCIGWGDASSVRHVLFIA